MYLKEACIETLREAELAEKHGADRIEFCSHLELDGLTPDYQEVSEALNQLTIPIMVMIRPRGGGFEYSDEEFEIMKEEVLKFKEMGVAGVVFGITKGRKIDFERTRELGELAYPLEVCVHKAIDEVDDLVEATEKLAEIDAITRILTSGGRRTAMEGVPTLLKMIEAANGRLSIMPAGKVRPENLEKLHELTKAVEFHGRGIV